MATVVAGFLSPWPLGWISATPRPLGVDRGHPQWPDLCIIFFFLVRWFAGERDMATEGGRISPPGRWGGSRPPPVAGSIFFFFFFWFAGNVAGVGRLVGGAVSRRWAVDFFGCLIC
jgi:hypothetical protein